jgi:endonuclease III
MTKDQIFEFFRRLAEDNPAPETELEYGNAYQLVVAVALSAQATDISVNKATRALFEWCPFSASCCSWTALDATKAFVAPTSALGTSTNFRSDDECAVE